jgi:hypothetical protein
MMMLSLSLSPSATTHRTEQSGAEKEETTIKIIHNIIKYLKDS